MDLLSTTEAAQKMGHLIKLRAAVNRARMDNALQKSRESAAILQRLQRDLAEFSSTMRPRLVQ
jgi:hypothetical protein